MIVLICDDQNSVHTFLENAINWKSVNIGNILHAYNGIQCLEILKSQTPDLLLLDIRMPQLTGIDILKEISRLHLHTITIILSVYSDFTYAKEALKLGAFDYELKPIDAPKLTQIITGALEHQMSEYLSYLYRYINGSSLEETMICRILDRLGIHRFLGILSVLPVTPHASESLQLSEYLQESYKYIIHLNDTELFILNPFDGNDYQEAIHSIQEQHRELCQIMPDSELNFSVSLPGEGISFLKTSLAQCRKALHEQFYSRTGFFVFCSHPASDTLQADLLQFRLRIYSCLTNANGKEKIPRILDNMFELFTQNRLDFDELTDICFDILYYNISVILNQNSEFEFELRRNIKNCRSLDELRSLMENTLMLRFFSNAADVTEKTPIQNIYTYLQKNFAETISLEDLSKKFFISKYALCRGFRQEYQEGLWDYLKRLRMEHAHLLLTTTDLKIYEVAERCGFADANYFSSTYRKYYGHTAFHAKKDNK